MGFREVRQQSSDVEISFTVNSNHWITDHCKTVFFFLVWRELLFGLEPRIDEFDLTIMSIDWLEYSCSNIIIIITILELDCGII